MTSFCCVFWSWWQISVHVEPPTGRYERSILVSALASVKRCAFSVVVNRIALGTVSRTTSRLLAPVTVVVTTADVSLLPAVSLAEARSL